MARRKPLDVSFGAKRVNPEDTLESGLPREMRNRPKGERRLAVKPSLLDYIRTGSEVAQGIRPENIPMTGMRVGKQLGPAIGGGLSALYDYARSTAPGQVVTDVLGAPARLGASIRQNPSMLYELIPGSGTVQGIREGAQRLAEGDPEAMRNAAALAAFAGAMDVIPGGGKGTNLAVKGVKELVEEGVDLGVKRAVENAPKLRIKPSPDDVNEVMQANTTAGRVVGNRTRNIDELTGGVSQAVDDQRRVDALVKEMSSPNGYISRLIVDDAGNVIEGQHRLEALRRLGVKDVPVTEYKDFERDIDFPALKDAIRSAQPMHSDNVNQLAASIAETYADEGGNLSEIAQYEPPKGFEQGWQAGIDALSFKPTESSLSVSKIPATATPAEEGVDLAAREGVQAAGKVRRGKYQPVEPVAEPHPELANVVFPQGSGLGGQFAIERNVPIVGRRPFIAQSPSGYSSLAGGLPANRVTAEVLPFVEMAPRQFITPEELAKEVGSVIPLVGDRLRGGSEILSVAGRPQEGAVKTYAGPDFPRQQIGFGGREVWASGPSVISATENMAKEAVDKFGNRVAGIYTTMGPTAADQTTAMIDLIGRQIAAGGVSQNDLRAFDDLVRSASRKDDVPTPDFIGFAKDPIAAAQQLNDIRNVSMGQRRTVTQLMNAKPWLEAGFPDIGANRAALSTPELLYAPAGTTGHMISMMEPGRGAIPAEAVSVSHPNYPVKLGGTYLGGFEVGVPRELVWPQLFGRLEGMGYEPVRRLEYLFGRPPVQIRKELGYDPRIQPLDQEWVDRVSAYINAVKKYGPEGYSHGGFAAKRDAFSVRAA